MTPAAARRWPRGLRPAAWALLPVSVLLGGFLASPWALGALPRSAVPRVAVPGARPLGPRLPCWEAPYTLHQPQLAEAVTQALAEQGFELHEGLVRMFEPHTRAQLVALRLDSEALGRARLGELGLVGTPARLELALARVDGLGTVLVGPFGVAEYRVPDLRPWGWGAGVLLGLGLVVLLTTRARSTPRSG